MNWDSEKPARKPRHKYHILAYKSRLRPYCFTCGAIAYYFIYLSSFKLSAGAHTIGRTTCGAMQHRLYDFHGTGEPDPSISPKYLKFLRRKCRWASEYVDLDAITPRTFDVMYYKNLQHNMGLLATDQMLGSDSRTSDLVATLVSKPSIFYSQFALSMEKLGNTQVLTGEDGEIRVNCNFVNPWGPQIPLLLMLQFLLLLLL